MMTRFSMGAARTCFIALLYRRGGKGRGPPRLSRRLNMGFLDKLKGAVNAVTGGAAKVTMEFEPKAVYPGDVVRVKISATSTGSEVKAKMPLRFTPRRRGQKRSRR